MRQPVKESRWNLRVAPEANERVRRAASERQESLTEFVLGAAVDAADRVLTDRTRFELDEAGWRELTLLLDRPVRDNPRLAKLFARPSVFD
jgi:uncharacterized protein (DUF1778 family)